MKLIKNMCITLLLSSTMMACFSSVAVAEISVTGFAFTQLENKFLWRGQDFDDYDADFFVEGAISLNIAENLNLGVWSIYDEGAEDLVETDFWVGYTFSLGELAALTLGNNYYTFKDYDSTNELFAMLGLNVFLAPTLTAYWDWDEAEGDGLFYTLAVSHAFDLAGPLTLNLGAEIGYNQQSDYLIGTYSDWHHGEVNAALDWAIHDQITITPMVRFSTGLSSAAEDEYVSWYPLEDETVMSLKTSLSW